MVDFDKGREQRLKWFEQTGGAAHGGLTVRDFFASEAMSVAFMRMTHNLTSDMGDEWSWGKVEYEMISELAYRLADHMMKERGKPAQSPAPTVEEAFGLGK